MIYQAVIGYEHEINEVLDVAESINTMLTEDVKFTVKYIIKDALIYCEVDINDSDIMFNIMMKYPEYEWIEKK